MKDISSTTKASITLYSFLYHFWWLPFSFILSFLFMKDRFSLFLGGWVPNVRYYCCGACCQMLCFELPCWRFTYLRFTFSEMILFLKVSCLLLSARWALITSLGIVRAYMSGKQTFRCTTRNEENKNGTGVMIFILCQEVSSYNYYVYHMQRTPEKPCLNDVTEVGTWRKTILTIAIILVVMTLLPVWDELAEELGIGLVTTFWFNTWAGKPILMLNEMKIAIFATFKWIVSYNLIRNSSTFYLYRLCVYIMSC